jgi:branched-chain amino acid transport system substrate-binding protein
LRCTLPQGTEAVFNKSTGGDSVHAVQPLKILVAEDHPINQKLAGLLVDVNDVNSLGLPTAQGLVFTESWYWDMSDENRKFAERFQAQNVGKYPGKIHAGVYSSVIHYLKAVEALKAKSDGAAVVKTMKSMPTDDVLFGKGEVRADGRKTHPVYLVEVKKPAESKRKWDYYKVLSTIPANEAFRPLKDGNCPLVN